MGALREDAKYIYTRAIEAVLPDEAVRRALDGADFPGRVILIAAGKAAWRMASAAVSALGERIDTGIVITKYGHAQGTIPGVVCREAGHPVPDENSFSAAREAIALTENLTADDTVLFLLSGGGSALFESPLVPGAELQDITAQLLACGADIVEINTIRQTPLGGEGRPVRASLRSGACVCRDIERHRRRPGGYDRLGSGIAGLVHVRGCARRRGKVRSPAERYRAGTPRAGDAENGGQRDGARHRQRPRAVRRRGKSLPRSWVYAGNPYQL